MPLVVCQYQVNSVTAQRKVMLDTLPANAAEASTTAAKILADSHNVPANQVIINSCKPVGFAFDVPKPPEPVKPSANAAESADKKADPSPDAGGDGKKADDKPKK